MLKQSIQSMLGQQPTKRIDPDATAFVLIDFQNEYFHVQEEAKLFVPCADQALANAIRMVERAESANVRVINVVQAAPTNSPLFAAGSSNAELHPMLLTKHGHIIMQKKAFSAFSNPDLHSMLQARGIKTIVLAGLMTHMCISSTARDACGLGYKTIVAEDACAARSLEPANGHLIPHDMLHRIALAELADAFAEVLPTDSIVGLFE